MSSWPAVRLCQRTLTLCEALSSRRLQHLHKHRFDRHLNLQPLRLIGRGFQATSATPGRRSERKRPGFGNMELILSTLKNGDFGSAGGVCAAPYISWDFTQRFSRPPVEVLAAPSVQRRLHCPCQCAPPEVSLIQERWRDTATVNRRPRTNPEPQ